MSRKNRIRKPQKESVAKSQRPTLSSDALRNWTIGLVLGVTFLAFSNTLLNDFAYDDQTQILKNRFIMDLRNAPKAMVTEAWFWQFEQDKDPNKQDKPTTPYYRPIVILYLMICWKLFGAGATGWHLLNLLLHLAVVYLVFRLFEKITGDLKLSAVGSLLFAIHPMRSESVAWISGVTDLLLALFLLSSFLFYLRFREAGRRSHLIYALALFLMAVFTKEPAVCLPMFIAAYELLISDQEKPFNERIKLAVACAGAFVVVSAIYFGMRFKALGFLLNDLSFKSYSISEVLLTIPLVIWKYIGLLLWPYNLSLFHETKLVHSPFALEFVLPALGLVALAFGLWQLRKSLVARFGILWFVINLLPVLNLRAFGPEFLVQERYVYLPSIGFSLLVAMALVRVPIERWFTLGSRRTAQAIVVALVVLALTGKTFAQNMVWKDDSTLWAHGVEAAPEQPMTHYILGHKYIDRVEPEKAIAELEAYMALKPDNIIVLSNLAAAHLVTYQFQAAVNPANADRSHLDRAVALCEKGLSVNDKQPTLWDTLGTVYTFDTGLRNYDRAVGCFERALRLQPDNGMVNFHLGAILGKQGNEDAAIHYLDTARQLQPDLADAYKLLAYVYRGKGQVQLAIDNLSEYLRLQPNAFDAQRVSKEVQDLQAQLRSSAAQS
ncbi:MAG TPA: tetratricopeptide repeat protein [Blastocatellia bacterium]|nr:tetratricopeptide repeat protein [Blastocatellia bacterium]